MVVVAVGLVTVQTDRAVRGNKCRHSGSVAKMQRLRQRQNGLVAAHGERP